ncbi:MAG TPA: ATP-binding protein [Burkholderiaceae bacterium]|jgi:PAS domain S-box-containing protein
MNSASLVGSVTTVGAELRATLDAVTAPLLLHDGRRIVHANAACQRMLSQSLPELLALQFEELAVDDSRDDLRQYGLRSVESDLELPSTELELKTGSGAVRAVEVTARPLSGFGQKLALFTFQDLSDIRHVQTSLFQIGRVLRQIIDSTPVATFVIDSEHRITHWNTACEQLTGTRAAQVIGRDDAGLVFYERVQPLLADLIVDGSISRESSRLYGQRCTPSSTIANAYEVESYFPLFGSGGRWLQFTAAPLFDADGKIVGAIETLLDVTQRRIAEDELLRHRNELENMVFERTAELLNTHHELEAFLENASVGIIAVSRRKITRANQKFRAMFEIGDCSPYGLSPRLLFDSDQQFETFRRTAIETLSSGEPLMHEMAMRTLGGRELWVQLIAYLANPADPKAGTWWMLQDRSEMRRVEKELQLNYERIQQTNWRLEEAQNQLLQSEKMASIGQLAAGVAHEINNPIGFVSSNLGVLRSYVQPLFALVDQLMRAPPEQLPPPVREELSRVGRSIDLAYVQEDLPSLLNESEEGLSRVKKIVQDLKDFSRVDHADWQDADLNAGLESTLNVVMNEVKYKAEIRKRYEPLPPVRCIAAQLNQVFMNLIVNAAQAIPQRGKITLSTRTDGDWAIVEIGDTGCGMSDEVKRRVFEPFFTTKPVGKGTGLGLSLSFSIVQKHGGRIEIDSTIGVGTTFRVCIPVGGPMGADAASLPTSL